MINPIWQKIDVGLCWNWKGTPNRFGYARIRYDRQIWLAHRLVWTLLVDEIPEGMTINQVCRNHMCVNPDHMEVVTPQENRRRSTSRAAMNARKTHCKNGHPFDEQSVRSDGRGRRCRVCASNQERARRDAQRALSGNRKEG